MHLVSKHLDSLHVLCYVFHVLCYVLPFPLNLRSGREVLSSEILSLKSEDEKTTLFTWASQSHFKITSNPGIINGEIYYCSVKMVSYCKESPLRSTLE